MRFFLVLLPILLTTSPARAAVPPYKADAEKAVKLPGMDTLRAKGAWISGAGPKDGLFRVRVKGHRRLDMTFLIRAVSGGAGVQRALGLKIRRGKVSLVAIEAGKERQLTRPRKMGWLRRRKQLEVVLYALGPHLLAALFEAPKGRAIMALTASGLKPGGGGVGVRVGKRQGKKTRILLASRRGACQAQISARMHWRPHLVARVRDEKVMAAHKVSVVLEKLPGDPPARAVRTSPAGVELLHCQGALLGLSTRIPWKYFDLGYLKSSLDLALDKPGYKLHRSFLSPAHVGTFIKALRKRHRKHSVLEVIGKSHQGRRIWALGVGKEIRKHPERPTMLIVGAHHGNEPLSVLFVLDAVQQVLEKAAAGDPAASRWLERLNIWFVPLANPDGLHAFLFKDRFYGRKNGRDRHPLTEENMDRGVDLNRNYAYRWNTETKRASSGDPKSRYYRGPSAGSEPETRAIMALARRERFVGLLSFHSGTVALLAPYTIDGVQNPDPNEAWTVAEHLIKDLPQHPQGKPWEVRRNLYSVDGTDQDWHRFAHGTVALLVEGSRWAPRKAHTRKKVIRALRPLWASLFDRFLDGPAISGKVLDADGKPVKAEVVIKEMAPAEGEKWTTRKRDGTFHRYLPAPGKYTVQVKAPDGATVERTVKVMEGRAEVMIKLETGN